MAYGNDFPPSPPLSTPLSQQQMAAIASAVVGQDLGNIVSTAVNAAFNATFCVVAATLSATTSTTQFPNLLKGDIVLDFTTPAHNGTVASAGTLPHAPTAADVLMVLRPNPAVTSFSF